MVALLWLFLGGCRRVEVQDPTPTEPANKLKAWYAKETSKRIQKNTNSRLTGADTIWYNFEPQWQEAQNEQLADGRTLAIIPLHRDIQVQYTGFIGYIRRLVVYQNAQGDVESGFIGELFGNNDFINQNERTLLKATQSDTLALSFKGAIITYTPLYEQITGKYYDNGIKVGNASFVPKYIEQISQRQDKSNSIGPPPTNPIYIDWGLWFPLLFGNGSGEVGNGSQTVVSVITATPPDEWEGGGGGGSSSPPPPPPLVIPPDALVAPSLPAVYDPQSFTNLGNFDPVVYNVFKSAQNTSRSHLQKAAWYKSNPPAGSDYHNVGTNFNTITGIMTEAEVIKEFMYKPFVSIAGQTIITAIASGGIVTGNNCFSYAFEQTEMIHAPNEKTDMVLKVNKNGGNNPFIINFFKGIKREEDRGYLDIILLPEYKEEVYEGPTDFVIEVKGVSPDNKDLFTIINNGVSQLNLNPLVKTQNYKPILVIDRGAFMKAYNDPDYRTSLDNFIDYLAELGGGVHLIPGLNSMTNTSKNQAMDYIKQNTNPPPPNYYQGTGESNDDFHEKFN